MKKSVEGTMHRFEDHGDCCWLITRVSTEALYKGQYPYKGWRVTVTWDEPREHTCKKMHPGARMVWQDSVGWWDYIIPGDANYRQWGEYCQFCGEKLG